jgi:hypothetical protein
MTTPDAPSPPPLPSAEDIAHQELRARVALEAAGIDVRDPRVCAALISIAVDAFRHDTKENLQQLVGDLHDVVQQRPVQHAYRGKNACCEHVARGVEPVAAAVDLNCLSNLGLPMVVLARLCADCARMDGRVALVTS